MSYLFLLFTLSISLYGESITLLSSANLKFFFSDILKEYRTHYPSDTINVSFDSSGNITSEILAGKQYDIFLSANKRYPQKLYDAGKALNKPSLYTTGSIILLISSDKGLNEKGIGILNNPAIKEITIANKKTAPYGMAAIEALKNANLFDKLESKLFYSTDASNIIGDVLWYGHSGILPKSAVGFLPRGYNIEGENWIEIDQKLYTPIEQYFVISKESSKNKITARFINFLLGDGQIVFKQNGYK